MRKFILRWLLGGDAKSWKEMFIIACECNENCKRMTEISKRWFARYNTIYEKQIAILEAVKDSFDLQLKAKVVEILNGSEKMDGGASV